MGSIILSKWPEKENFHVKLASLFLFLEINAIPCEKSAKKLKMSYNGVYYSLQRTAQTGSNRVEREVGGPGAQLSKKTSILESLV